MKLATLAALLALLVGGCKDGGIVVDDDTADDDVSPFDQDNDGYDADEDCDDNDPDTYPGADELCDGVDNDCDYLVPDDEADVDIDGWMACEGDCDDLDYTVHPEAEELCDGIDNDCDDEVPSDETDSDGDGFSVCDGDCDDDDDAIHPEADEVCDDVDDDCDGDAIESSLCPPMQANFYIMYGYPSILESASVDAYMAVAGGSYNGTYWTWSDGDRSYEIHQYDEESGMVEGVQDPDGIVVYAGHSNFGLGATFSDLENHSDIEYVETIDDIFNVGSETVAINFTYLKEEQTYPNFELREADIVDVPVNYSVPGPGMDRFPNTAGIGPGDPFSVIEQDAYGYPYHYVDASDGFYKTIVWGGNGDLPTQDMHYQIAFVRSCNSGRYFAETYNRGVLFYSTDDVNYEVAIVYLFVRGIIEGYSYEGIRDLMNAADPIYEYFDFDEYPAPQAPGICPAS